MFCGNLANNFLVSKQARVTCPAPVFTQQIEAHPLARCPLCRYNGSTAQEECTMANQEQLERLRQGANVWNAWRKEQDPNFHPDLSGADLSGANLGGADLTGARLSDANLSVARLMGADL